MTTASLPAYSLNAIKSHKVTCPTCGARQVSAVTSCDWRQGEMVRITFDCEHGRVMARVVARVKKGRKR